MMCGVSECQRRVCLLICEMVELEGGMLLAGSDQLL